MDNSKHSTAPQFLPGAHFLAMSQRAGLSSPTVPLNERDRDQSLRILKGLESAEQGIGEEGERQGWAPEVHVTVPH